MFWFAKRGRIVLYVLWDAPKVGRCLWCTMSYRHCACFRSLGGFFLYFLFFIFFRAMDLFFFSFRIVRVR